MLSKLLNIVWNIVGITIGLGVIALMVLGLIEILNNYGVI